MNDKRDISIKYNKILGSIELLLEDLYLDRPTSKEEFNKSKHERTKKVIQELMTKAKKLSD